MPRVCIVLLLVFLALTIQAQQKEQNLYSKPDSAILKLKRNTDAEVSALDSVDKTFRAGEKKIQAINGKASHAIDSLKPDLARYEHKLDSVKGNLTHRIDSLKNLNLPTEQYSKLLDSLNAGGPLHNIKEAEAKLAALQTKMKEPYNKANQSVANLNGKVNEKLNLFNKEGGNLPGSTSLQGLNLPGSNQSMPNTNLNFNQSAGVKNSIKGTNTPSTNLNVPGNKFNGMGNSPGFNFTRPKIEIPKTDIQKSFSEASEVSGKLKGYSKDFKNITSGNPENVNQLSKDAEKEALKLGELKGLQQNQAELSQYQSMAGQAKDAEAMKALGKQEIQKEAINHFAGKEQMLQQAMNKMSSLKMKYSELSSLKDTLKRRPNAMHGKPLKERIIPGLTMQFINGKDFTMDLNPSIAYRLSGRINAGVGWVERIHISNWQIKRTNPVYGVRSIGDFKIKKGLWARAEVEYINAMIPQQSYGGGPTDTGRRIWEWNVATGLKKDFQLFKSIRGNVQTLYRIWGNYDQTPYPERLIVRMGFEFPMKKGK